VNRTTGAALALLITSLTGLTSCTKAASPVSKNVVELEVSSHYPGLQDRRALLITDAAEWQKIWVQMSVGLSEVPTLPAVDFQRHSVVVVSLGQRPSGGFNASMELASVDGSKAHVIVTERAPGAQCVVTLEVTHPTFTALIPSPLRDVSFENRRVAKPCG